MSQSVMPVTVRPTAEHIRENRVGQDWTPEQIERVRGLLAGVRVLGTEPLEPTLAAVAEYLEHAGVHFEDIDRVGQLNQMASLTGWGGPLQEYMSVPGVANIQINGAGEDLIIEYTSGQRDVVRGARLSVRWAEYLVARWLAHQGKLVAPGHPLNMAFGTVGDLRFTYFGPRHARRGMTLQIRMPMARPSLADLVERGLFTWDVVQWLRALIQARANILVSGGTNAGKTTLVSALLGEIDPMERVGVIEAFGELNVSDRPGTVAYEMGPDADENDLAKLLHGNQYNSVRRLVLGEVRGGEAAQLLMAMNSGVAGCIATIHAESANEAPRRLAQCARMSRTMEGLSQVELFQMVAALGLIVVHVRIMPGDGKRRLTQMIEVFDAREQNFSHHDIFRLDAQGELVYAEPQLSPRLWERLTEAGVRDLPTGKPKGKGKR
jgi:pilus assembly protein CpaF